MIRKSRNLMAIRISKLLELYTEINRGKVLTSAALLLAAIILVDWLIFPSIPIGGFYILPILLAAGFLNRYQLICPGPRLRGLA